MFKKFLSLLEGGSVVNTTPRSPKTKQIVNQCRKIRVTRCLQHDK